jgi:hypothetical protein
MQLLDGAKKVVLLLAGSAVQRYLQALAEEQEVVGVLSDLVMEVYAMESALLRTQKKLARAGAETCAAECDATRAYVCEAAVRMEQGARRALARIAEGDTLRTQLALLRRWLRHTPYDVIRLRRQLANRALELNRYPFW